MDDVLHEFIASFLVTFAFAFVRICISNFAFDECEFWLTSSHP